VDAVMAEEHPAPYAASVSPANSAVVAAATSTPRHLSAYRADSRSPRTATAATHAPAV
jgi:hypothetical protein